MNAASDIKPSHRGFTLVELLVVIGVIALLISILIPALSRARAQANQIKCMSNLRELYTFTQLYATDNRDYWMPANAVNGYWEAGDWYGQLARYYFKADLSNGANWATGSTALSRINSSSMINLLACPSNTRPTYDPTVSVGSTTSSATSMLWTYIYNRNLGDLTKFMSTTGDATARSQYGLKKRINVPPFVLVAADMSAVLPTGYANNARFFTFTREVNPLDGSYPTLGGYVAAVHGAKSNPTINVLLADGEVVNCYQKMFNNVPNRYSIDGRDWYMESPSRQAGIDNHTTQQLQ